jgi:hypothetical protein
MVSAVFNPFSLAPSQSFLSAKQQFFALVLTAVGGLIINILFHIVRSTGRARRFVLLLTKQAFSPSSLFHATRTHVVELSTVDPLNSCSGLMRSVSLPFTPANVVSSNKDL